VNRQSRFHPPASKGCQHVEAALNLWGIKLLVFCDQCATPLYTWVWGRHITTHIKEIAFLEIKRPYENGSGVGHAGLKMFRQNTGLLYRRYNLPRTDERIFQ
jgi:hypothetical protein